MILVIDNYDSFTYNLVQYLGEMGCILEIVRNDQVSVSDIRRMHPERIVISPGPCTPADAGTILDVVRELHKEYPILGVCLGHQAIGQALGGRIVKAPEIVHGKTSDIHHRAGGLFLNVPTPFTATRYHSLIVEKATLPACLEVTAWTSTGIIMGLRHREFPTFGVQFHPESIATENGKQILANFLKMSL
ncbi:MAG: aminodeoxychorismate/anthranilate synthase component II [Ignavibacteriales bacterium]|nr:aminodeoxychorismate/anthranilate synthase component II [Ignavibacteriales bacterium]